MENHAMNSSRVKVEYTDPSGIYPLVVNDLNSRLPLRNLHWNSASRPLRSIDSLFVELVPDEQTAAPRRSASVAGLPPQDVTSPPIVPDGRRGSEPFPPRKERRHQIPGLRQTPYLKIYLLRCDDGDTYKSSARKLLREWIKAHTPPSQSSASLNSQENHDAFEWMIIHVVLPDVQNNSPWPNKASTSVLDKVRADFNASSKAGIDRIAQIPATKSLQVQGKEINPIPTGLAREEFLKEVNRAWEDLLSKVKALILTSFDLRVRQYEEDIKEKMSQRSLPGWNFCTFFVLKEGLARGFESVGLVEDALMGYDELSVELSVAIQEQKEKAIAGQETGIFKDHTEELLAEAELAEAEAYDASKKETSNKPGLPLLDADRKQFRDLILASDISAFDFQNYVFARQVSLLSRMAKLAPPSGGSTGDGEVEDMMVLAEICRRAVLFITLAGGMMREDLRASFKPKENANETALAVRHNVIDYLVVSWTYSSCQQILRKTLPKFLVQQLQQLAPGPVGLLKSPPLNGSPSNGASDMSGPLPSLPARTTSLIGRPTSSIISPNQDNFLEELAFANRKPVPMETQTGLYALAEQRATIYLVARRALRSLGQRQGWSLGWPGFVDADTLDDDDMGNVSLDDTVEKATNDVESKQADPAKPPSTLYGLQEPSLYSVLASRASFYSTYEDLTTTAYSHYTLSANNKSAHAMVADIALIKFYTGNYAAASAYFHKLAPFYSRDDWVGLEVSILNMYAQCLKKLERWDEFVKVCLRLLASNATSVHQDSESKGKKAAETQMTSHGGSNLNASQYLGDLLAASKTLKEPLATPLMNYCSNVHVDPIIKHFEEKDGFKLVISMKYMIPAALIVEQVQLRLVSVGEGPSREIWLSSPASINMRKGLVKVTVTSNVMVPDWYMVDKLIMQAENIIFTHDLLVGEGTKLFAGSRASMSSDGLSAMGSRILVWPSNRSFDIHVSLYKEIHLEHPRSILCELFTGSNAILHGELHIRPASAGLRLHTANAEMMGGGSDLSDVSKPGVIAFEGAPENSTVQIRVPYKLDSDVKEISLRTQVAYTTSSGVNVHDVFKQDVLFSKFAISSSTAVPIRLLDCRLEGTPDFEATTPRMEMRGLCIFSKQPASMVYKIVRKKHDKQSKESLQNKLSMQIKYVCLDEEVLATTVDEFQKGLAKSDFFELSRLLLAFLRTSLRVRVFVQNLELVGLLREFNLGSYQELHWDHIVNTLDIETRPKLRKWLMQWHIEHKTISLPVGNEKEEECQMRRIIIPVDVPQMQIVHTAELHLLHGSAENYNPDTAVVIGDSIPATLELSYSCVWDTTGDQTPPSESRTLDFFYELEASPDTWIIGGRRRAQYTAHENETVTFPILLIPQKAGHLLYPSIEIKGVEELGLRDVASPQGTGGLNAGLTCELDYRNQGEAVLVVPNRASTTIGMDLDGGNGGPAAWVVESRVRRTK